jgi:Na+/alanine symporter
MNVAIEPAVKLLTQWSRVILEKLIVARPFKKCIAFYETRRFITMFTGARHWDLYRALCTAVTFVSAVRKLKFKWNLAPLLNNM